MSVKDAQTIFKAAVEAVQPERLLREQIFLDDQTLLIGDCSFDRKNLGKVIVIGAGKAVSAMAVAVERILLPVISDGVIITKHGHSLPLRKILCLEAGHPVPDQAGLDATNRMLQALKKLDKADLVIFLVSGGASALMVDVPPEIQLDDVQLLIRELLASGATIDEINCVRKHLSLLKGGQLSQQAFPARVVSLILSDVNGDDLSVIASGPTVADPSTFPDAIEVLTRYKIDKRVARAIIDRLQAGADGLVPETVKPGDDRLARTTNLLVGTNALSLQQAEKTAVSLGYHTQILNRRLEGEATTKAKEFVDACLLYKGPKPACLLMGGETTVTITGKGLGGRNQHFTLAALCELISRQSAEVECPVILSAGTDGTDGPTDATGAVLDAHHLLTGDEAFRFLTDNDAYHFFEKHGGLIKTGPTQTNVMDVVIALIR